MPYSSRILLILFFLFLGTLDATAQASLEILVFDPATRTLVVDAEVHLVNVQVGLAAQSTTDEQGKVRFAGLTTAGSYDVFVPASSGYHEARAEGVQLRTSFTRSVILLLYPVAEVTLDEITVTGSSSYARINTINAEVASTLTEREVDLLPVEGRDLTRALYRLPNVTQATGFYPEAPNVSINGANSLYVNYLIDGLDNNENFLGGQKFAVPVGIVQDVTVLSANFSAEFGRTGNGVFNATTRSGGNTLTGEAFYVTRPGQPLDAESPYAQRDLSGNAVKDGFRRHQGGFSVSGPLRRDRTFFILDAEHTQDFKDNLLSVPQLGMSETVAGHNRFTYLSGKVDHRWSDRLRSSLRAHVGFIEIERQGGGLDGGVTFPSAANIQNRNSVLLALQNTYLGAGFLYEGHVQYSRFRWNYARPEDEDSPQVVVLDDQEQTLAVLGHPGFFFDDLENTVQVQQKLTLPRRRHTFKLGADLLSADFALTGGGNPGGNYTVKLSPAQTEALRGTVDSRLGINDIPRDVEVLGYGVELQPRAFGTRQTMLGLYVEDLISVTSRFNVTLGLRYDYDNLSQGGSDRGDYNNLAPRLSFNYALDARSSLRGGYGLFYDKILYAVYSDALQQNSTAEGFRQQLRSLIDLGILPADTDLDRVTFDGNLTVNPDPAGIDYLEGPTPATVQDLRETTFSNERRILNPDGYQNPYTHQFSLGYQQQAGSDLLFYVDVMHARSYNLFRLRDLNAPAPYRITPKDVATTDDPTALVRTPAEADATRPVVPVPGGARSIVVSETAGEARYWAANFNLLKDRGSNPYAFRFSYTLSRLRNNTEDINFKAQDANDFGAEWGPSINDRTHVVSGIVYYYPLPSLGLSLAALIQSGQPVNRIPDATRFGTTDLNGDGRSFGDAYVGNSDRSPGETRNSDRLPWSYTLDLGAQYRLSAPGGAFELRADIFNVLNTENLSGFFNNATQSNQIQVGPAGSRIVRRNAAPPRQFQFGLRYIF